MLLTVCNMEGPKCFQRGGFPAFGAPGLTAKEAFPKQLKARDGSVTKALHLAIVRFACAERFRNVGAILGASRPPTCIKQTIHMSS